MWRFEHHSEPVITRKHFIKRMWRYSLFAGGLITVSVGGGTLGYKLTAHTDWVDSFHMSCMILTGMGPVLEMKTNAAKLFSSFFALYSGIAFLTISAVFFSPIVHRVLHGLHVAEENKKKGGSK